MSNPPLWLGMSETHLIAVDDKHQLQPAAAEAFHAMQRAAQADGIDLQIVSSFRSFSRQQHIWDEKWRGNRTLFSLEGSKLEPASLSDEQKLHAILTWSALPGASRHHWGTDLDVYDKSAVAKWGKEFELVSEEYAPGGPCHRLADWLQIHAAAYGFYRPYAEYTGGVAPEAWHLSYRPLAEEIIRQLDCDILREQLSASDICGKAQIMEHLPQIFRQYTLNGQTL